MGWEARSHRPAQVQPHAESQHVDWLFVESLCPTEQSAEYSQLELCSDKIVYR